MEDINDSETGSVLNYTIDKLSEIENISMRTSNVCKAAGLNSLKDIMEFYKKNKSFITLKDCGAKTNNELVDLCNKYKDYPIVSNSLDDKAKTDENINEYINFTLNELKSFENLSVRTINICRSVDLDNLEDIINYFQKNKTFLKIRNCGVITEIELKTLYTKYKKIISTQNETDLIYTSLITKISISSGINITDYISDFNDYYKNKNIPLLKVIDVVLFNSNYFENVDKDIIKNFYKGESLTLQEIGDANGLTKERIRQRKCKILDKIFNKNDVISYIINTLLDFSDKEYLLLKDDFFIVETSLVNKINSENRTNLGIDFIGNILALCNPGYKIISNQMHRKHFYLLKNKYDQNYVKNFVEYLESITKVRRTENILIKWEDVLSINVSDYKTDYLKSEELKEKLKKELYVLLNGKTMQGVYRRNGEIYFNKNRKKIKNYISKINFNDLLNCDWTYDTEINKIIKDKIDDYKNKEEKARKMYRKKIKNEKNILKEIYTEYLSIFKVIAKNEFNLNFDNENISQVQVRSATQ